MWGTPGGERGEEVRGIGQERCLGREEGIRPAGKKERKEKIGPSLGCGEKKKKKIDGLGWAEKKEGKRKGFPFLNLIQTYSIQI
jgi:hypothetical protein